jgi:hypothetical protein
MKPSMVSSWSAAVALALLMVSLSVCHSFQFMKNFKMPTYDPHEEAVKERFGDKSTYRRQWNEP